MNTQNEMNATPLMKQPKNPSFDQDSGAPAETKSAGFKMPSVAGISLPELAVIGAAGFVIWKNREQIKTLLSDNGIEVPALLSGDFKELLRQNQTTSRESDGQASGEKIARGNTSPSSKFDG